MLDIYKARLELSQLRADLTQCINDALDTDLTDMIDDERAAMVDARQAANRLDDLLCILHYIIDDNEAENYDERERDYTLQLSPDQQEWANMLPPEYR